MSFRVINRTQSSIKQTLNITNKNKSLIEAATIIIENNRIESERQIQQVNTEVAQTKQEVAQTKQEVAQTKQEVAQTKQEVAQTKQEVAQTKQEVTDTGLNIGQIMASIAQNQADIKRNSDSSHDHDYGTNTIVMYSGGNFISVVDSFITYIQVTVIEVIPSESKFQIAVNGVVKKTVQIPCPANSEEACIVLDTINLEIKQNDVVSISSGVSAEFLVYLGPEEVKNTTRIEKKIAVGNEQKNTLFYLSNVPKILDAMFD